MEDEKFLVDRDHPLVLREYQKLFAQQLQKEIEKGHTDIVILKKRVKC